MEYPERIQRSIDYIETHLHDQLSFEEIARQAFVSIAHLYRIFPYMTGCSVGQYIRKRRITSSVYDLLETTKRIIDIAFDYQFESQESYIRAFKAMFGVTPGEYRKSKGVIALYHPLHLNILQTKGGLPMQPDIITKKYLLVGAETGIDLRYDFTETMERLRHTLKQSIDSIDSKISPVRMVGIWSPYGGGEEDSAKRLYFTGVEVSSTVRVPGNLVIKDLPNSIFARFREKTRGTTSRYAYMEWLPASGYILNEDLMCDLEIFDDIEHYGTDDACDILLPVRTHNQS